MPETSKRIVFLIIAVTVYSTTAYAYPPSAQSTNNNCGTCHTSAQDRSEVINYDTIISINGSDPLKLFNVVPGVSNPLSIQINDGHDVFAVQIKDFENTGVLHGLTLNFTPDSNWAEQVGGNPSYYTIPQLGGDSWQNPVTRTWDMLVPLDAPAEVYKLTFSVAGTNDGMWHDDEEIFIAIIPEPASLIILTSGVAWLFTRRRMP